MALVALNLKPEARQLRQFGVMGAVFFAILVGLAQWRGSIFGFAIAPESLQNTSMVLGGIAALFGALAVVFPKALTPVFLVLSVITFPIGFVLSHVLIFAMFYLLFTPIGLLMRAFGWDAMDRKLDKSASSYWVKRDPVPNVARYFRQY